VVESTVEGCDGSPLVSVEDVLDADARARARATELVERRLAPV
jgi:hypothetical protein